MDEIIGLCPICKEWTEITREDNGCCGSGCYSEGGHVTSENIETKYKESTNEKD